MIVHWVHIRRIWRPLVFGDEIWTIGPQPVLCAARSVCWRAVLLEDESGGQQAIAVFDEIWKQMANVICAINFSLFFNKMQPSFSTEAHTNRHHNMLRKLFVLSQNTTLLDAGFLSTSPNAIILITHRRIKIEIFLIGKEYVFSVTNFEPTKQSLCALQSLLFSGVVDDLSQQRQNAVRCSSCFAIWRTDLSLMLSLAAILRLLECCPVSASCEQISSSTAAMFVSERADFSRPERVSRHQSRLRFRR